jgi:hypothetical protein
VACLICGRGTRARVEVRSRTFPTHPSLARCAAGGPVGRRPGPARASWWRAAAAGETGTARPARAMVHGARGGRRPQPRRPHCATGPQQPGSRRLGRRRGGRAVVAAPRSGASGAGETRIDSDQGRLRARGPVGGTRRPAPRPAAAHARPARPGSPCARSPARSRARSGSGRPGLTGRR